MSSPLLSVQENVDLTSLNTLHIHAHARYFADVKTKRELKELLGKPRWTDTPIFVLGGGSNVLFVGDYDGLVVHIAITGRKVKKEDENYVWLTIGAGENWHRTVQYCVGKGWGGIENLSLIPGTVGAAPIQNIGAYGVELQDVFESLTAVEIKTGNTQTFSKENCRFGYRDSIFKNALKNCFIVTDVTLKLSKDPDLHIGYGAIQHELEQKNIITPTIRDISDIIIDIRNSKLPDSSKLANAGSFFKNPIISNSKFEALREQYPAIPGYPFEDRQTKVAAGWLIEQAGWKGKKAGNVGVYGKQALVIINCGGATGKEVLEFAGRIRQSVKKIFGIQLVPEVNIISNVQLNCFEME